MFGQLSSCVQTLGGRPYLVILHAWLAFQVKGGRRGRVVPARQPGVSDMSRVLSTWPGTQTSGRPINVYVAVTTCTALNPIPLPWQRRGFMVRASLPRTASEREIKG